MYGIKSKQMKILHIIGDMDPQNGGVCQAVRTIAKGLYQTLGIVSEVASVDDPDSSFLKDESLTIHALGPEKKPWSYSPHLYPWLIQNLPRFDVVIIHGLWLYQSYGVRKALLSLGKSKVSVPRLFVMPHGMLDPYFQRAPDRRMKAFRNWIYWKLIESKTINFANGVLFTCEAELLLARQPYRPYRPKRELNVGLGIEPPPSVEPIMLEEFFKCCPEIRGNSYILFLGRINEKKGVDLLIDGYAKTFNAESPKLVIAGPGLDSEYGQKIRQLVSGNARIKDAVFFPGMLKGAAKWGALYGAEAFALTSHQENFGIAVAEAMACGKPVLISNQVNIWKEIQETGGGLVANDTPTGAKDLFIQWENLTYEEKQEMGRRATLGFEKHFAIVPVVKRLAEAIQS